jgi:hypothetical protein
MSKPESNHTPWYTVRVKELLDPPSNQTVRPRRTLIECYVSDLDRATFLFNEFAGISDPAAEMARLRKIEKAMVEITRLAAERTESQVPSNTFEFAVMRVVLETYDRAFTAAKVGGGA